MPSENSQGMNGSDHNPNKGHRASKAGAKYEKKIAHTKKKKDQSTARHNPKAFNVTNIGKTKRTMQRNLDIAQRKERVEQVNRAESLPPPPVVVVMGPKGKFLKVFIYSNVICFKL